MGNAFGYTIDNGINLVLHPDVTPNPLTDPKNNPTEGFSAPRKERKIKASIEEMQSAKIPLDKRDYCVDKLLLFKACRRDNFPWTVKCEHEKHEYLHCQYEDYLIRMKEFERERRLMERAKKHGVEYQGQAVY